MTYLEPPRPDPKGNPMLEHVKDQYVTGKMNRGQFMRYATLLGMSVTGAGTFLAACGGNGTEAEQEPEGEPTQTAEVDIGQAVRGGTWRWGMQILEVDHPHRLSWVQSSNVLRQVNEYLTFTDSDNVTHPYLLDRWEVNDDATVWTLHLRQGIMFTNDQEFTAADVMWNFESWFDPDTGSSVLGLMAPYLDLNGVERVDDYTVRLNCKEPQIAVPEHLYHYPAQILQRGYEPPDLDAGESFVGVAIGTGPYILEEFRVGSRARVSRNPNYWRQAPDGEPFPFIDEIVWTDLGPEDAPYIAALESGQIDTMWGPEVTDFQRFRDREGFVAQAVPTAQTALFRMRTDMEPFTDPDVRNAFKLLQPREEMANTAYFGAVDLGHDAHFAPACPDYVEKEIPPQDIERARQLLEGSDVWQEWGNQPIPLTYKNDTRYEPVMAETFARAAEQADVNIQLDQRPATEYWPRWNHYHFGLTEWTHRPLNMMVNALAYTREAVPEDEQSANWNETRWVNDEFLQLLDQANATPDLEERLELVSRMQDIQQEDGAVGIAFFRNIFTISSDKVKNHRGHPTDYQHGTETWIEA